MRARSACHAAALACGLGAVAAAQDRAVVVEAARVVVAPGTVLDGPAAKIAFRGSEVVAVGTEIPRELAAGARVVTYDGATVVPGFVVGHDWLEVRDDLAESIDAFTPALPSADAFDPFDAALARLARGGVTTVGLAPTSRNTVGGIGAAVQWRAGEGRVLAPATYVKAALVAEALDQGRYPTSRMGAGDLIRSAFRRAASPLAGLDADHRVLADVLGQSKRLAIHASAEGEIVEALDLCGELGIEPILIGGEDASDCIARIKQARASLMLAPLTLDSKLRRLQLPGRLHEAGVTFSFLGSHPAELRMSMALAVRAGLPRDVALAAVTRVPAEQLGLADRVGALRTGRAADFSVRTPSGIAT
jgi:imidazolonepropionase-like amidohydrolase